MANGQQLPGSGSERSILRSGPLAKPNGKVNLAEMIFVPWGCLGLIFTCFLFDEGSSLALIPTTLLVLAGLFTYTRYTAGRHAEVVLGMLCVLAIFLGVAVGLYAQASFLNEYWRLDRGASYYNVLPSELATSKNDATMMNFVEGTRVDTGKTFGYLDGGSDSGTTYCVAPISSGISEETRIQYWAAGTDCCYSREDFHCGDSAKEGALGAVVRPRSTAQRSGYVSAIDGAMKAYGLQAGNEYLLVKWVQDPVAYRDALWKRAMMLFWGICGVYLLLSAMIGCTVFPQIKSK